MSALSEAQADVRRLRSEVESLRSRPGHTSRCCFINVDIAEENGSIRVVQALIPGCPGVAYTGDIAQCNCDTLEAECQSRVSEMAAKLRLERARCARLEARLEDPTIRHGWDMRAVIVRRIYERSERQRQEAFHARTTVDTKPSLR